MIQTTEAYFAEQDTFSNWLADCCDISPSNADTTSRLYDDWSFYARQNGEDPGAKKGFFPEKLSQHGFAPIKDKHGIRGRGWLGLSVALQDDDFDPATSQDE